MSSADPPLALTAGETGDDHYDRAAALVQGHRVQLGLDPVAWLPRHAADGSGS